MEYYGVEEDIPVVERPGLALSIESSLGITAGGKQTAAPPSMRFETSPELDS